MLTMNYQDLFSGEKLFLCYGDSEITAIMYFQTGKLCIFCSSPIGDGKAGSGIVKILKEAIT